MSAYGAISKPSSEVQLPATIWKVKSKDPSLETQYVFMFHLTLASAPSDLVAFMHKEFADELERGDTYPQEPEEGTRISRDAFESYYFAADVFIGLHVRHGEVEKMGIATAMTTSKEAGLELHKEIKLDLIKGSRTWNDCVSGFYYVKPNYPGRSSHICNAGFVVPFQARGQGFGQVLARSYLHNAPQLGYQASVFNLVYVNNAASIRLWDALGFEKAGRIPRAGRLKRKDGHGEDYVDAWIIYKNFGS